MQERRNALELRLFCTNPSKCVCMKQSWDRLIQPPLMGPLQYEDVDGAAVAIDAMLLTLGIVGFVFAISSSGVGCGVLCCCTRNQVSKLGPGERDNIVKKGNIFLVTRPLCWEFTWSPVKSPNKGQWRRVLMLSLSCPWINSWIGEWHHHEYKRCKGEAGIENYATVFVHKDRGADICKIVSVSLCQLTGQPHRLVASILTPLPQDKVVVILADDIFKCIFVNEVYGICYRFRWSLFRRFEITIYQHWIR